jgi:hypothetical protein
MPSPKDIKKVLNTAQGTKAAGKAMDLEELLGTLPKGSKAQQLEAELMFKRLAEEQAARYAPTNPPTKRGNAALAEAKKTLAKKQAPAVIIPSKISNVERAVRESRGEFGAKRVQRAADQIKNLDDQYTEEALRRAFAGDNTNLLMIGNPAEFKNFAAELIAPYRPGIEKYLWEMSNKNTRPSEIPLEARRQGNVVWEGGATDVPFLELNQKEGKLPFVSGHEGRHRNLAMEELGYPSTLWRMMPRAALREDFPRRDPEEYLNALIEHLGTREPLVVPEGKDWADAINLPELFAEGGGVHMAGGGKALKVLKGAGKAADATQDIQSIVSAGKPLTAAERAMVDKMNAEYAASQPVTTSSKTGKVGSTKVRSTVHEPERMAYPGIYQRPDVIAAEAASRVADESPNLKKVFGVTRDDLFQMGKGRQGNLPGDLPGAAAKPKGSKAAAKVMTKKNEQRLIDTMAEAEKYPALVQGMDPWYIMDPVYQRMEQLLGRDKAIEEYRKLNTLMGMSSPGSEVLTEIPRGTAAYYLQNQGRFSDFVKYAGQPAGSRGADFPQDILNVPGHAYHKTAQATPMQQYLESGEMQMNSPKVPMYIEASGSPLSGFQTRTPVGDAHWSRAVGLADTRGAATRKGQPVIPGASVTNPEMSLLAPWWRESIAAPMGLESVPAQARAWGTFSGQTGVTTPIGAPKIELLADKIAETAYRLGVSLDKARDLVLTGQTYAGKKDGGPVHMAGGNEPGQSIGEMFKPKPLTIPSPLTDMADALRRQFSRERRSMSKPGAATDVLLRGPVAFAAGTPMDLIGMAGEGLDYLQTKIPGLRERSVMDQPRSVVDKSPPVLGYQPKFKIGPDGTMPYGTEDFQNKLRRAGLTTDEERPLFELGTAIVAPGAAQKALKYGKASAQALAPTAKDMLQMQLEKLSEPTRSYVIKPEGGNWVKGSVESYLDPFGYRGSLAPENFPEYNQSGARAATAINNFVDKKLSKYMRNEMGTPSDSVRIQADEWVDKKTQLLADKQKQIDKAQADMEKAQRERNVNPEMLTRSQARIRELEKEKALIENRSGLHYEPPNAAFQAGLRRKNSKQLSSVEAKTETGKKWEDVADASITGGEYRFQTPLLDNELYIRGSSADRLKAEEDALREIGGEFAVQNPDAMVNKIDRGFANTGLGWDHLTDELFNAMSIESGLPQSLLLDPKTVDKMSVPQAIEHVDKINAWRASQRAEADAARAANVATVVHKEYPDAGLKWVELKVPELIEQFKVPDRYEIKKPTPSSQTFAIWDKEKAQYVTSGLGSEEAAAQQVQRMIGEDALQDALKYEGEMLGHCVGGYCPDVISGKSRIFSLRDQTGKPHATIETNPNSVQTGLFNLDEAEKDALIQEVKDKYYGGVMPGIREEEKFFDLIDEAYVKKYGPPPAKIKQIKGESNQAPKDDVLPYVQDFVKGQEWSDVGDLSNTGLFKVTNGQKLPGFSKEITPGYYTLDDFKRIAAENEMPQEILDNWMSKLERQAKYGFVYAEGGAVAMAAGGAVDYESRFNQMLQDHVAGMAEGGAVDYESRFNDMLQKHVQSMAEGGAVNPYNEDPDMADGGRFIQAPAFADGGAVKSIWTVN